MRKLKVNGKCGKGHLLTTANIGIRKNRTGIAQYCLICSSAWYQENKARLSNYSKEWKKRNRKRHVELNRWSRLKRSYGITRKDYEALLGSQDYKCAICGSDQPRGRYRNFFVDHDHVSGKIRGLLCNDCNLAIGKFKEDVSIIDKALKYLLGPAT